MSRPNFGQAYWESLWTTTIEQHAQKIAAHAPNRYLIEEASQLAPGRALDMGCGCGAEAIWLAERGWLVTAVDFSPSALAQGARTAKAHGGDVSKHIAWIEGALATWDAPQDKFDLAISLYVHIASSEEAMIEKLAGSVRIGGTLLLVGHRPVDPVTGKPTAAIHQNQVSVEGAASALDSSCWELLTAEQRTRGVKGTGVDAVIWARRKA